MHLSVRQFTAYISIQCQVLNDFKNYKFEFLPLITHMLQIQYVARHVKSCKPQSWL